MKRALAVLVTAGQMAAMGPSTIAQNPPLPVDAHNFARAETDLYMSRTVQDGGFGKFLHSRVATPIDKHSLHQVA